MASLLIPTITWAQTQADVDAAQRQSEIIQRQEQERLRRDQEEVRQRTERVDGIDTKTLQPKIEVPAIGTSCRTISNVVINNAPNLTPSVRRRIADEFSGRCLNAGDIERVMAEITKDYIDRGYITARAYLPSQDLSKGHLKILVVEGVLGEITIDDDNANSVSVNNVFPNLEGNLFNLRDIEQGVDQINRLSSNNAKIDIQPGEKPGVSNLVVHNQPSSPFHFNIALDNQGSESTGATQAGLTASADNLLGFNELFSATHRESTPSDPGHKNSKSDNLNFSIPFGYTTLSMGTSHSEYASTVPMPSGLALVASGNNKTDNIRIDRVMYRDQSTRASLAATITTKQSKNYLDDQFLGVSSRDLTVLDLDGNINTKFAGGTLTLDIGYAKGLKSAGALRDPDNLLADMPHAQFGKIKAGINYARPFKLFNRDFSVTSQLTAQKAEDVLYGSEQISIGSLSSVRGSVRNTLAGDDGYYWRNEVSVHQPLSIGGEAVPTRFYAGYDTGEVKNIAPNIPQGRMDGMVVGLSAKRGNASLDLFNTRPLKLPSSMTKESSQTWVGMAYSF